MPVSKPLTCEDLRKEFSDCDVMCCCGCKTNGWNRNICAVHGKLPNGWSYKACCVVHREIVRLIQSGKIKNVH